MQAEILSFFPCFLSNLNMKRQIRKRLQRRYSNAFRLFFGSAYRFFVFSAFRLFFLNRPACKLLEMLSYSVNGMPKAIAAVETSHRIAADSAYGGFLHLIAAASSAILFLTDRKKDCPNSRTVLLIHQENHLTAHTLHPPAQSACWHRRHASPSSCKPDPSRRRFHSWNASPAEPGRYPAC